MAEYQMSHASTKAFAAAQIAEARDVGCGSNPGVGRWAWQRIKYLRKLTKLLQRSRSVRTDRITLTTDPGRTSDAKL
jgi:hypothetical protein